MSSYRPPYRRYPDREAEKREAARKAEEETKRKTEMNDANFPTLVSARVQTSARGAPAGNKYARLAEKWAVDDEVDRRLEEYKKAQEERKRRETENTFVFRQHQRERESRFEYYQEEYDEDVSAPSYRPVGLDDEGWTTIDRKTRKEKRDLTVEEMDRMQAEQDRKEEDFELNGHLFESNRHDHDRV